MKSKFLVLRIALIIYIPLFASCSKTLTKSENLVEAERQAQAWFDSSFTKCGETFVTRYKGQRIGSIGMWMDDGYIQHKLLTFVVEERPLSEADKLNGIEWQGSVLILPMKQTIRYLKSGENKWSDWKETSIIYDPPLYLPQLEKEISPFVRDFKKAKGQWVGLSSDKGSFTKVECSQIPN